MAMPNTNMRQVKGQMSNRLSVGDYARNLAAGRLGKISEGSFGGLLQNISSDIATTGTGMGQLAVLGGQAVLDKEARSKLATIAKSLPKGVLELMKSYVLNPVQTAYEHPVTTATAVIAPMASPRVSAAKVALTQKIKQMGTPGVSKGATGVSTVSGKSGLQLKAEELDQQNATALSDIKGKTIGQTQQQVQTPDLTAYEKAINAGDLQTAKAMATSHPGDARFQIHTQSWFKPTQPKGVGEGISKTVRTSVAPLMREKNDISKTLLGLEKSVNRPGILGNKKVNQYTYDQAIKQLYPRLKQINEEIERLGVDPASGRALGLK